MQNHVRLGVIVYEKKMRGKYQLSNLGLRITAGIIVVHVPVNMHTPVTRSIIKHRQFSDQMIEHPRSVLNIRSYHRTPTHTATWLAGETVPNVQVGG